MTQAVLDEEFRNTILGYIETFEVGDCVELIITNDLVDSKDAYNLHARIRIQIKGYIKHLNESSCLRVFSIHKGALNEISENTITRFFIVKTSPAVIVSIQDDKLKAITSFEDDISTILSFFLQEYEGANCVVE